MTISLPQFKRGDTFSLSCVYKKNGVPNTIANVEIKSQIRSDTSLITELNVTKANQSTNAGTFILTPASSNTATWPLGNLLCDIQFSENGVIRSTETFYVSIIEQVTL